MRLDILSTELEIPRSAVIRRAVKELYGRVIGSDPSRGKKPLQRSSFPKAQRG